MREKRSIRAEEDGRMRDFCAVMERSRNRRAYAMERYVQRKTFRIVRTEDHDSLLYPVSIQASICSYRARVPTKLIDNYSDDVRNISAVKEAMDIPISILLSRRLLYSWLIASRGQIRILIWVITICGS